jgi:muramoyltetrapeptide carboxypeptidase
MAAPETVTRTIKPAALAPGDLVGVAAPASGIRPDMLAAGVWELESMGFRATLRDDITSVERYLAGSVERRFAEFHGLLVDPDVKAIFCARGGYGSGHLLGRLKRGEIRGHPKILCGSSDITMLLAAYAKAGVVAFHGPMVATTIRNGAGGFDRDLFLRTLVEGEAVLFDTRACEVLQAGRAEGRLTGGCLTLVTATIGTRWELDTDDSILVLEDVDTRPYQLDRMLTHLKQAGKLERVRGIVFGDMPGCAQHPDQGYTIQDLLRSVLADFDGPILFGFPTGHSSGPNAIVPFGVTAELALDSDPTFRLMEPAVTKQP